MRGGGEAYNFLGLISNRVGGNAVKPVKAWPGAPRMKTDLDNQRRYVPGPQFKLSIT